MELIALAYTISAGFMWLALYRSAPEPTGQAIHAISAMPNPRLGRTLYKMITTLPLAILWPLTVILVGWNTVRDLKRRGRK